MGRIGDNTTEEKAGKTKYEYVTARANKVLTSDVDESGGWEATNYRYDETLSAFHFSERVM